MKAFDGLSEEYAFLPGEGWSSENTEQFRNLLGEYGFVPKEEPPYLVSKESQNYTRGGVIVAGEGGTPTLIQAWKLYEAAFVSARAPQVTIVTVVSALDQPLSLITNTGKIDTAFTAPVPQRVKELGVTVRDEINSEWFLSPSKQQLYILRRRLLIGSEGIVSRLNHSRVHLPLFPPGLVAELSLGAPVAAVSRCTSPGQTPAIERISNDTTVLMWSNVRVTLVNQVISHKQLTHKTILWSAETPKHLPSQTS